MTEKNDSGFIWLVVVLLLLAFISGIALGVHRGRDEACMQTCPTKYSWWGDDRCVCADEQELTQ